MIINIIDIDILIFVAESVPDITEWPIFITFLMWKKVIKRKGTPSRINQQIFLSTNPSGNYYSSSVTLPHRINDTDHKGGEPNKSRDI